MIKILIFVMLNTIVNNHNHKLKKSPKADLSVFHNVGIKQSVVGDYFKMENEYKEISIAGYKILVNKNGDCLRCSRKKKDSIIDCSPKKLNPVDNGNGYGRFNINDKTTYVHRIVAMAFIPNPENKPHINHINGIKTDNRVENLEWCTSEENNNHARVNGLMKQNGEHSVRSILTNEDVMEIFNSPHTCSYLAVKFNTCRGNISCIKVGKSWSHLTGKVYIKKTKWSRHNI